MPQNTEASADQPFPMAVVIDRTTGAASHGMILPAADPTGRDARLVNVGLMSAGIAHDLGNLMQIIEAGMRGMERRFGGGPNPEFLLLSKEVRGAALRASALTRRIVQHAQGGANLVEETDVGALIMRMQALIGWAAGPSIQLILEVETRLRLTRCAPAELESAVINLVFNARHAMPDGGVLTLSVYGRGEDVMLRVADTGCGMPPEAVRWICEPFVTSRAGEGGSGLGLAIVRAFVRGAGGAISVDSSPGRGTTITLTFRGVEPGPQS